MSVIWSDPCHLFVYCTRVGNLPSKCMAARRSFSKALQEVVLPQNLLAQHSSYFTSEVDINAGYSSTLDCSKSEFKAQ